MTAHAQIQWRHGPAETRQALNPAQINARLNTLSARPDASRVLLRFHAPLVPAENDWLADAGVTLLDYVGDHAWFARLDPAGLKPARIANAGLVAAVEPIQPAWKLHPDLAAGDLPSWSIVRRGGAAEAPKGKDAGKREGDAEDATAAVYVRFHADVALDTEAAAVIRGLGGEVRTLVRSAHMIVAHLPAARIEALAGEDAVLYVEPPLPALGETNAENRVLTHVNEVNAAPYNLSGAGIDVLVYDSGKARTTHLGFTYVPLTSASDATPVTDHSTHVAGTIGGGDTGAPGIDPAQRGMAPEVQLISYGFEQAGGSAPGFLYTD
ncbi:MAG: hypothetical protein KDA21_06535, partial [Phycisphaerales bacterium]|nr:hypothetical protein [Phycisphaerales bacterium]